MSQRSLATKSRAIDDTVDESVFSHSDPLTEVLESVRLRCTMPTPHEFTAPWGVRFGALDPAQIMKKIQEMGFIVEGPPPKVQGEVVAVLRGQCLLEMPDFNIKLTLASGDVVLIARPNAFILRDDWKSPVRTVHELVDREAIKHRQGLRYGGGGASATILAGPFSLQDADDHPLLAALPPAIHVRSDDPDAGPWLENTLKFMNSELSKWRPGSAGIVNHLAHVLFVESVRTFAASLPEQSTSNWLRGIFDPELASALHAMHTRPEEAWTVSTLAEQAGLSRSAFAARFSQVMGTSPLQYLTDCRMRLAKSLLHDGRVAIKLIASKIGYANKSAFGNAFRRATGISPAAYRVRQSK